MSERGKTVTQDERRGTSRAREPTPPAGENNAGRRAGRRSKGIVTGQFVDGAKLEAAREMRSRMTPAEALLWQRLRRNALDGLHFRRQQVIAGFVVDFYCHAAALVVEVDGAIHSVRHSYDDARDNVLRSRGVRILRLPNSTVVGDTEGALNLIRAAAR